MSDHVNTVISSSDLPSLGANPSGPLGSNPFNAHCTIISIFFFSLSCSSSLSISAFGSAFFPGLELPPLFPFFDFSCLLLLENTLPHLFAATLWKKMLHTIMIWFSTLVPIRPPFYQEPPSNFMFVLIFILVSQLYYVHVRAHFLQTNNLVSNCVVIAWLVNPSQEGSRDNKSVFQSSGFFQNNKHQSFVLHSLLFPKKEISSLSLISILS